jgi:hypothetical protein
VLTSRDRVSLTTVNLGPDVSAQVGFADAFTRGGSPAFAVATHLLSTPLSPTSCCSRGSSIMAATK